MHAASFKPVDVGLATRVHNGRSSQIADDDRRYGCVGGRQAEIRLCLRLSLARPWVSHRLLSHTPARLGLAFATARAFFGFFLAEATFAAGAALRLVLAAFVVARLGLALADRV